MAKVAVKTVYKIYPGEEGRGVMLVRDVSFEIKDGEFVVLVGPSGCFFAPAICVISRLPFEGRAV